DRTAPDALDPIARPQICFRRRCARTYAHDGHLGDIASAFGRRRLHRLDLHAQKSAANPSEFDKIGGNSPRAVGGYSVAHAGDAPAPTRKCRVDPDDLSAQINQWSARI